MNNYKIQLYENNVLIRFECMAETRDHAIEQAMSAYPQGRVAITRIKRVSNSLAHLNTSPFTDDDDEEFPQLEDPSPESLRIRHINAMARFPNANQATIERYVDLKLEGYGEHQAQLMSGLADPHE